MFVVMPTSILLRISSEIYNFVLIVNLVFYSDRFLPDKAIDLIDEAGSRVRLRHAQVGPHFLV